MRAALLSALLLGATLASARTTWDMLNASYTYEAYASEFPHAVAPGHPEYAMRKAIFESNLARVMAHNANPTKTWKVRAHCLVSHRGRGGRRQRSPCVLAPLGRRDRGPNSLHSAPSAFRGCPAAVVPPPSAHTRAFVCSGAFGPRAGRLWPQPCPLQACPTALGRSGGCRLPPARPPSALPSL